MKKNSIKIHLISIGALLVVLLILNFIFPHVFNKPRASLMVDYGGKNVRIFAGEVIEQMTILDALWASSQGATLKFEYDWKNNNSVFLSVEGQSEQLKIKLNKNSVPINMISQTIINQGDLIEIELP